MGHYLMDMFDSYEERQELIRKLSTPSTIEDKEKSRRDWLEAISRASKKK